MKRARKIVKSDGATAAKKRSVAVAVAVTKNVPLSADLLAKVLHYSDIVLHCLAPFLPLRDFIALLRCDKRLYSMSPAHFSVLRECCRRYGNKHDATDKWIARCIKRDSIKALSFVLERTKTEYLAIKTHKTRHDDTGMALVAYTTIGFKSALKYGSESVFMHLLDWHARLQLIDPDGSIRHLIHHEGTGIDLPSVLPRALYKGVSSGHGDLVRKLIETEFQGLAFPNDGINHGARTATETLEISRNLLLECVCAGDVTNYDFFVCLYENHRARVRGERTHRYGANPNSTPWGDRMCQELLQYGKSTALLPRLLAITEFMDEFGFDMQLSNAIDNPHPAMFDYIVGAASMETLRASEDVFKEEYETLERLYRETLGVLQIDVTCRKLQKKCDLMQKRLVRLKFILENMLGVDWEKYRPYRSVYYERTRWKVAGRE